MCDNVDQRYSKEPCMSETYEKDDFVLFYDEAIGGLALGMVIHVSADHLLVQLEGGPVCVPLRHVRTYLRQEVLKKIAKHRQAFRAELMQLAS